MFLPKLFLKIRYKTKLASHHRVSYFVTDSWHARTSAVVVVDVMVAILTPGSRALSSMLLLHSTEMPHSTTLKLLATTDKVAAHCEGPSGLLGPKGIPSRGALEETVPSLEWSSATP